MASIRKRIAKGCINYSYQVQIRRKGLPSFTLSFVTYEEARKWVEENEEKYIENPESFEYLKNDYTNLRREREFNMKFMEDYRPRILPKNISEEIMKGKK